jgi:hypothetical protein
VRAIVPDVRIAHNQFAATMLEKLDKDNEFLKKTTFSDQATFPVSGKVNKQNIDMWGSEHPHATGEHIKHSPKVNVWCSLLIIPDCSIQQLPGYGGKLCLSTVTGTALCHVLPVRWHISLLELDYACFS